MDKKIAFVRSICMTVIGYSSAISAIFAEIVTLSQTIIHAIFRDDRSHQTTAICYSYLILAIPANAQLHAQKRRVQNFISISQY